MNFTYFKSFQFLFFSEMQITELTELEVFTVTVSTWYTCNMAAITII